jgi:hypothetical protein
MYGTFRRGSFQTRPLSFHAACGIPYFSPGGTTSFIAGRCKPPVQNRPTFKALKGRKKITDDEKWKIEKFLIISDIQLPRLLTFFLSTINFLLKISLAFHWQLLYYYEK